MSKTWKWILGILLVLLLVVVLFSAGFMWQTRNGSGWGMHFDRDWNGPMMQRQWNQQVPGQWVHPMMDPRGFSPFGGFFLLGGLLKWVLFFGLIYGAYWLGRRNARIAVDPQPAAPLIETSSPAVEPEPAPRESAKKVE